MNSISLSGFIWIGIGLCLSQSAMFSGLNLAVFSISRMRLEVEASSGNQHARKVLDMRKDSNFLLTTILWGNVGINVLLTLLSNSVMLGATAFIFSTFVITFAGEILPQAYFSRHALRMASLLSPVLTFYKILLFPFAKPSALVLDWWLGQEGIHYFRETDLREVIKMHMRAENAEVDHVEGKGALNFLAIDDVIIGQEGETVDPRSVLPLPFQSGRPVFPDMDRTCEDPFLKQIEASREKWVVLTDLDGHPQLAIDSDAFLRAALFHHGAFHPTRYCHRPIIATDPKARLGELLQKMRYKPEKPDDDVIDQDIILFWGNEKRIITGADILGRLMRGISEPLSS